MRGKTPIAPNPSENPAQALGLPHVQKLTMGVTAGHIQSLHLKGAAR